MSVKSGISSSLIILLILSNIYTWHFKKGGCSQCCMHCTYVHVYAIVLQNVVCINKQHINIVLVSYIMISDNLIKYFKKYNLKIQK